MNEHLNDLAILVNSCDSYQDLWEPFFKLFSKYGGQLASCPIYLNAEKANFSYEGLDIRCPNNYEKDVAWGERVKNCLKEINQKYVLFLLDDFFLQRAVDIETLSKCIEWLKDNPKIGAFSLLSLKESEEPSEEFPGFCFIRPNTNYRLNSQAAIWDKEILDFSLLEIESPWEWESLGNLRNSKLLKNIQFYCISELISEPFFYNSEFHNKKYSPDILRNAVIRGKWDLSCIEECFRENDINMDFSIRGLCDRQEKVCVEKKTFIQRCKDSIRYRVRYFIRTVRRLMAPFQRNTRYYQLIKKPIKEIKKRERSLYEKILNRGK